MEYVITDDQGRSMDAHMTIGAEAIFFHSRGGTRGTPNARNTEYGPALRLILKRIASSGLGCSGIWLDSSQVQHLPLAQRLVLAAPELSDPAAFTLVSRRMQNIGTKRVGLARGNSNRRLRIGMPGSASEDQIAAMLRAVPAPIEPGPKPAAAGLVAIEDEGELGSEIGRFREILHGAPVSGSIWSVGTGSGVTVRSGLIGDDPVTTFMLDGAPVVQFRMRANMPDGNATGAIARDRRGSVLVHKGILSLGPGLRTRASTFEDQHGWGRVPVSFPGRGTRQWYEIGALDDPEFREAVIAFVRFCARLKSGPVPKALSTEEKSSEPAAAKGKSTVPPRPATTREWIEDEIRQQLRAALLSRGVESDVRSVGAYSCDLFAETPAEVIFELKKGNEAAHYYCAIGQLLFYRSIMKRPEARLVAVLERCSTSRFHEPLREMGIRLLEFTSDGLGSYSFIGLDQLLKAIKSQP